MAEHRQWLRDTQLEPGTGGDVYDLAHEQGDTAGSVSNSNDTESFVEVLRWQRGDVAGLEDTTVPTSVNITGLSDDVLWDPEVRWRLQRLDNTGTVRESSDYSPVVGATGIHTADLTLDTRWNPGDLFALSLEARRNGGVSGTVTVTVATQDDDSFADVRVLREAKGSIRRPVPPIKRYPVEARFWVRTRAVVTAYVRGETVVDVGPEVRHRGHARTPPALPKSRRAVLSRPDDVAVQDNEEALVQLMLAPPTVRLATADEHAATAALLADALDVDHVRAAALEALEDYVRGAAEARGVAP